ncbi:tetratricopeptide repeat protein [Amycolatopsis sp. lyj-109]|uniref:tetratricopeptide repeat protein n=1 Tax=Amycolatopsis sp. lyj-109 TaxID=2789287 RepID=UPI00397A8E4B
MAFWNRKQSKTTEHVTGDFGSAEISVTERRGDVPLVNVKLSVTPEYAKGLEFQRNREELGLLHPETLRSVHEYAVQLGELPERRGDAIELLEWLVSARADDPENRLLALNDLTRLLQAAGNLAVAEQRLREALSGWERLRGPDDRQTLGIASNLASVLLDLRRPEEAEGLMRDTAARCTRAFGPAHPETVRARNTLAGALRGTPDRLAEATRLYEGILADIGEDGEQALAVRHNLAAVLIHRGEHAEALRRYRELIAARTRQQGAGHPDTWRSRHNYAVVLTKIGDPARAEAELTEVLEGYRQVFGHRHTATLDVQVDLAAVRANQGRPQAAVPLLRDAIEGYHSTLGPQHPRVRELSAILGQLGG